MPEVGVLALQGDFAAHARALRAAGCDPVEIRSPDALDSLDGIVLPGGESTTMLKFLADGGFAARLRAFVLQRPTLATCAGAILLAARVRSPAQDSLGLLDVTVVRNAYGRQLQSSIRSAAILPAFQPALGSATMEAVLIRAPRFLDPGPGVEIVARDHDQPLLLRQGHILAASFHPELSVDSPVHRWFAQML